MRKEIVFTLVFLMTLGILYSARINDWSMRIGVKSSTSRDSYNFFGVSREASLYFDAKDLLEPPPSPSGLRLYFPHEDWPEHPGRYATDYRPPVADTESYEFVVEVESGSELTLFWSVEEVPRVYDVTLMDVEQGKAINMKEKTEYNFDISPKGKKEFRVVVEWKRLK